MDLTNHPRDDRYRRCCQCWGDHWKGGICILVFCGGLLGRWKIGEIGDSMWMGWWGWAIVGSLFVIIYFIDNNFGWSGWVTDWLENAMERDWNIRKGKKLISLYFWYKILYYIENLRRIVFGNSFLYFWLQWDTISIFVIFWVILYQIINNGWQHAVNNYQVKENTFSYGR